MKKETITIENKSVTAYTYEALVIGSGAAGLNAADCLFDLGVETAVITEGLFMGTSINTGSDKQTYYKLSCAGEERDSVYDMAKTLYSCGCMEGYHALCEAALSLKCFYKLIFLGVDFPHNSYGEYVGYRTDHDERKRATSCGPLTSKYMAEALMKSVKSKKIDLYEKQRVSRILTDGEKVYGVVCVNTDDGENIVFLSGNVIMATGGPASVYFSSVYPKSQTGSLGVALEAGAHAVNLTEWQYGIASTDFRWNLSGTYMQVIPRFVSIDEKGIEREFLGDYIKENICDLIFLKGYNWPFSPLKLAESNQSSLIDLAVYNERKRGRNVYLDYTRSPSDYDVKRLSSEARDYLLKSGAEKLKTPIERLIHMNEKAYRLYLDNADIDLKKELLEIDVCAQHCNGGIKCDENYETCISGLYAAGECAGVFGVSRPGGTALNSTQVSSLRTAEHIARQRRIAPQLTDQVLTKLKEYFSLQEILLDGKNTFSKLLQNRKAYSSMMTKYASIIRNRQNIEKAEAELSKFIESFYADNAVSEKYLLSQALINRDILLSASAILKAQKSYIEKGKKNRGSFIIASEKDISNIEKLIGMEIESDCESLINITFDGKEFYEYDTVVSKLPASEQWFETVYNDYYKK